MSRRVELDFHVLRQRDSPSCEHWRSAEHSVAWLQSQLDEYVERHSAEALFDSLVKGLDGWGRPHDVVVRVRELIEVGWIDVQPRSFSASAAGQTSSVLEEAVSISELVPEEEPSAVDPEGPADPVAANQVATLLAAARSGTPFCEVCTAEPPARAAVDSTKPTSAAQVAVLLAAAESGAPFCEVCA